MSLADYGLKVGDKIRIGTDHDYNFEDYEEVTIKIDDHPYIPDCLKSDGSIVAFSLDREGWVKAGDKPKSQWFGKKYRVTPETNRLLQEAVFADEGLGWISTIGCWGLNKKYIFVDHDGLLTYTDNEVYFNEHEYPEGVISVKQILVLEDVVTPKSEEDIKREEIQENIRKQEKFLEELKEQFNNL